MEVSMVTIEPIPASRNSIYYTGSYYTGGGGRSEFIGTGCEQLKIDGLMVEPDRFENLWKGLYPDKNKEIVQIQKNRGKGKRKDNHTPGTDLCINLDKSASIAYATGTPEKRLAIEKAALANARELVSYLEENCAFSRRGNGGHKLEKAGLTAAAFFEFTNRNGEPHCHTHVVLLNVVWRDSDRSFGTMIRRPLYQNKMAAGALVRGDMAARLTAMGLTCSRPENAKGRKAWHYVVEGVPNTVREAMSSRANEVRAKLQEWGQSGSKAAARAAVETRGEKVFLPLEKLIPRWEKTLTSLGFTPTNAHALWGKPSERSPEFEQKRADSAVNRAIASLTAQEAVFTTKQLTQEAAIIAQDGGVLANNLRKAVSERLQSRDVVLLTEIGGEKLFTTQNVLERERKLIDLVEESKTLRGACVPSHLVEKAIKRIEVNATKEKHRIDPHAPAIKLTDEQRNAIFRSCQGSLQDGTGSIRVVTGHAGAGKTTAVAAIVEALHLSGRKDKHLVGCSMSDVATQNLQRETGLKTCVNVAKLLHELEKNPVSDLKHHARQLVRAAQKKKTSRPERLKLGPKSVVILDESATLGCESMTRLVEVVRKRGATLICLGDHRQLQHPVEAGCPHVTMEKTLGAARLTEITRQRTEADRKNVYGLSEGKAAEVLEDLKARGRLHVTINKETTLREVVRSWKEFGSARPDEHVMISQTNVEREKLNTLAQSARRESGHLRSKSIRLGPDRRQFFENDAVIFTTPAQYDKKVMPALRNYDIANGTQAVLVGIDHRKNQLQFKIRDRVVTVPVTHCSSALDLGYCLTAHRVQSKTYESAHVAVGGSMTHKELAYVIASRARGETHLFCERSSLPYLADQMSRSRAKTMAHDFLPSQEQQLVRTHVHTLQGDQT
jgi:conjugative relaxase-like TrwC/TraI family protein